MTILGTQKTTLEDRLLAVQVAEDLAIDPFHHRQKKTTPESRLLAGAEVVAEVTVDHLHDQMETTTPKTLQLQVRKALVG